MHQKENELRLSIWMFVDGYIKNEEYPPTYREIADALDISSTSVVSYHLDILEEQGFISRRENRARTLKVLVEPPLVT